MTDTTIAARRPRGEQRGAVAVEFALVMPLLIMLMLGITTTGVSYSHSIGLANAVREGARFGATTDATAATWATDVIAQVRGTQFDDATSETGICVQLWKKGSLTQQFGSCSAGAVAGLALPANETAAPRVPASVPTGACVVRVVAGRNFTINIGLASWTRVNESTSVARYERSDKYPTCAA